MEKRIYLEEDTFWKELTALTRAKSCSLVASDRGKIEWQSRAPTDLRQLPILSVGSNLESDVIIAFGGGAIIDQAKAIVFRSLQNIARDKHDRPTRIFAIPTVSGSGAEATQFAAVWDERGKHSIEDDRLKPSLVMLCPSFSETVPMEVAEAAALDAISHSLECAWSRARHQLKSDAISTNLRQLVAALSGLGSVKDRADMMLCSTNAGVLISQTRTALSHAISYPITSELGIRHGFAASFTLAEVARHNYRADPSCLDAIATGLNCAPSEAPDVIETILRRLLKRRVPTPREVMQLRGSMTNSARANNNLVLTTEHEAREIACKAAERFLHD